MKRRDFLLSGGAFVASSLVLPAVAGSDKRIFRLGVMTDTHVGKTIESCSRVRAAARLFKARSCDLIVNLGDIVDRHSAEALSAYRQTVDAVYAGAAKPDEVFVYAWHDAFEYKNTSREEVVEASFGAFPEVQRILKAKNKPLDAFVFRGYPFLVFPQFVGFPGYLGYAEYEKRVADACTAHLGKPVFVLDHIPPWDTVYSSRNGGDWKRRRILGKYPQVIDLCGHLHGSLRNDLLIWQDAFTVVNAGCLQAWEGEILASTREPRKESYGVLTIDVFANRLEVRRWDVRDGSEIGADARWIVPLPHDQSTAPYRYEPRKGRARAPQFAANAAVTLALDKATDALEVSFPTAQGEAFTYRAELLRDTGGAREPFVWRETMSEFWKRPEDRTGRSAVCFPSALLEPDIRCRARVTPYNAFGIAGRPIVSETLELPKELGGKALKFLWEMENPLEKLKLERERRQAKLYFPTGIFAGPPRERFLVVLDIVTSQPKSDSTIWFKLMGTDGVKLGGKVRTVAGMDCAMRYLLWIKRPRDAKSPETFLDIRDWTDEKPARKFRILRMRAYKCL